MKWVALIILVLMAGCSSGVEVSNATVNGVEESWAADVGVWFDLKNTSGRSLTAIKGKVLYQDPGRSSEFFSGPFEWSAVGGVEPGETVTVKCRVEYALPFGVNPELVGVDVTPADHPSGQWLVRVDSVKHGETWGSAAATSVASTIKAAR